MARRESSEASSGDGKVTLRIAGEVAHAHKYFKAEEGMLPQKS
jgi:hypothetical protein